MSNADRPRWQVAIPTGIAATEHQTDEGDGTGVLGGDARVIAFTAKQIDRTMITLHDIAKTSGPPWISCEETGMIADPAAALSLVRPRIGEAFDSDERDGLSLLADALDDAVRRRVSLLFDFGAEPIITRQTPIHPTGDRSVLIIGTDDVDGIFDTPGALWNLTHVLIHRYDMVMVRDRMDAGFRATPSGEMLRARMEMLAETIMGYGLWCVVNGGIPLTD
ncbi:hypothetical protein [Bifidobacterium saguinibicoloris]|uniref:hypothetical protein n=1 Tax=Bifidobacterium saguinibicoloris TaxID=2834433 RepID=UPI001C55A772|nr:hypothetical protein [Bifidobacterium saguinibicoloris]MBW3079871.1 hypothetical protein [Bifidobacterium saguinibicoloris]